MAALNFPNSPGGQTPANTFSPTSTPDSSTNGVTYIYNSTNDTWTAQTSDSGNLYLSKITNDVAAGVISFTTGLNVNGTAVINLQPNGNASISGTLTAGTYAGLPVSSTSGSGIVQLSTSTSSTSQTTAATTSAVKTAYDRGSAGVTAAATAQSAAESAASAASVADGKAVAAQNTANAANSAAGGAQSTADAALPKTGGTISGNLIVTGSINGGSYIGLPSASTSASGIVQLSSSISSTSTSLAGTASSVKSAYDRGSAGVSAAGTAQSAADAAASAASTAQGTANSASSAASAAQGTANSATSAAAAAQSTANAAMPKSGGTFSGQVAFNGQNVIVNSGTPSNFDGVVRFRNTATGSLEKGAIVNNDVVFGFGDTIPATFQFQSSNGSLILDMNGDCPKWVIRKDSGDNVTYETNATFNRSSGNLIVRGKVTASNIAGFASTLSSQAAAATDLAGLKTAIANALVVLHTFTAEELAGD